MPKKKVKKHSTAKILVVDDDESTRKTLSLILGQNGYEITTVGTGHEAIEAAQNACFDMVLLDLRLPDMAGTDALQTLKELHPKTPIIMVTGYATPDSALLAMDRGAAGYVTKPIDIEGLTKRLESTLNEVKTSSVSRHNTTLKVSNETVIRLLTDDLGKIQDNVTKLKIDVVRLDTNQSHIKGTQVAVNASLKDINKKLDNYTSAVTKYNATTDERFKWQEKMQKLIMVLIVFIIGLILTFQFGIGFPVP